jgi:hypothetical protein
MFVCRFRPIKNEKNKKIKINKKTKGEMNVIRTCCFSELKRL